MCTGGTAGLVPVQLTEAGSGMEMEEEEEEEEGGWRPGMELEEEGGGPVGGRTGLNG